MYSRENNQPEEEDFVEAPGGPPRPPSIHRLILLIQHQAKTIRECKQLLQFNYVKMEALQKQIRTLQRRLGTDELHGS